MLVDHLTFSCYCCCCCLRFGDDDGVNFVAVEIFVDDDGCVMVVSVIFRRVQVAIQEASRLQGNTTWQAKDDLMKGR